MDLEKEITDNIICREMPSVENIIVEQESRDFEVALAPKENMALNFLNQQNTHEIENKSLVSVDKHTNSMISTQVIVPIKLKYYGSCVLLKFMSPNVSNIAYNLVSI